MTDIEIPLSNPVNGFKPTSWGAPVEDLVKEYEAMTGSTLEKTSGGLRRRLHRRVNPCK